jgi:hypothetical protein
MFCTPHKKFSFEFSRSKNFTLKKATMGKNTRATPKSEKELTPIDYEIGNKRARSKTSDNNQSKTNKDTKKNPAAKAKVQKKLLLKQQQPKKHNKNQLVQKKGNAPKASAKKTTPASASPQIAKPSKLDKKEEHNKPNAQQSLFSEEIGKSIICLQRSNLCC